MEKSIGFIGCGNMAQAMIGGIIKSGLKKPLSVMASNTSSGKLQAVKERYGIATTTNNIDIAKEADIVVLAVKPNKYPDVINEIKGYIKEDAIIVIIAAGITMEKVAEGFGGGIKVARTMPNTPALVGEAMSALCFNSEVSENEKNEVISIFESFGKVEIVEEKLMDVIPAISGSSPAYVYMFIEALADGGVLQGIPRSKAYKLAAQAVLGAAKMVLETGEHPGVLKDNVCSPGGTTIEAVYTLEKNNFRGAVISAMESCTEKAVKMSKK
jgi:pyrroline-5-carboxylate reductase